MSNEKPEPIFYHTSDGKKVHPENMSIFHLVNAEKKLAIAGETDVPVYKLIVEEIKKRKENQQ